MSPIDTKSPTWPDILRKRDIPSLNGIRGLAAMAVVISHVRIAGVSLVPYSIGPYAVVCFFVLSGFLITNLLLQEHDRTGSTSLRKFYTRRTLRIIPASWVFCCFFLFVSFLLKKSVSWPQVWASAFYYSNYYLAFHGFGTTMNHTWSLAIEEQFYLLWPAVFRRVTGKQDRLVILLTGAIVAVWCYRGILEYWIVVRWEYVYGAFGTRADALAIGCLIAVVAHQDRIPRWLMSTTVAVAATLTIVSVTLARIGHGIELYVLPLAFAVLILHAVSYHQSPVYGWLSWRPLQVLGSWSYSVYLYHIMVNRIVPDSLGWFKLPADVFVAVLLGAASYYLVEKPVLSFRDRFFGSESRRGSSAIPSLGSGPHGPTVPRLPTQTSPDLLASEDEVETVARQV